MLLFPNMSIKKRITFVIMLICSFSIFLLSTTSLLSGHRESKKNLTEEIALIAKIIGERSVVAISFNNPQNAERNLNLLRQEENITFE